MHVVEKSIQKSTSKSEKRAGMLTLLPPRVQTCSLISGEESGGDCGGSTKGEAWEKGGLNNSVPGDKSNHLHFDSVR